jgi:hypothetical protein
MQHPPIIEEIKSKGKPIIISQHYLFTMNKIVMRQWDGTEPKFQSIKDFYSTIAVFLITPKTKAI